MVLTPGGFCCFSGDTSQTPSFVVSRESLINDMHVSVNGKKRNCILYITSPLSGVLLLRFEVVHQT